MKPRMNHKLLLLLLGLLTAIPQTVAAFRKQSDPKLMGKPAQGQHLQDRDHSIKVDVNLVPVLLTVSDHHALLEAENISSGNCYIALFQAVRETIIHGEPSAISIGPDYIPRSYYWDEQF